MKWPRMQRALTQCQLVVAALMTVSVQTLPLTRKTSLQIVRPFAGVNFQ